MPSAVALGTHADVMGGSPCNCLYSWYGSGARTRSFPLDFGADIITSAAAGQIDGDDWVELVVATSAGSVYCLELRSSSYPRDALWWPMYGHDRARTHCYGFEVPTAVEEDLAATPKATALASIYPNPFNPTTKIAFDLSAKGHVELAIYDVSGRTVAVLVDRELEAGRHEAFWNGKTAGGTTARVRRLFLPFGHGDGEYFKETCAFAVIAAGWGKIASSARGQARQPGPLIFSRAWQDSNLQPTD